jgi:hypothetical protein
MPGGGHRRERPRQTSFWASHIVSNGREGCTTVSRLQHPSIFERQAAFSCWGALGVTLSREIFRLWSAHIANWYPPNFGLGLEEPHPHWRQRGNGEARR